MGGLYWPSSRATEPEVGCRLRRACWESQGVDGSGSGEDRIASGGVAASIKLPFVFIPANSRKRWKKKAPPSSLLPSASPASTRPSHP